MARDLARLQRQQADLRGGQARVQAQARPAPVSPAVPPKPIGGKPVLDIAKKAPLSPQIPQSPKPPQLPEKKLSLGEILAQARDRAESRHGAAEIEDILPIEPAESPTGIQAGKEPAKTKATAPGVIDREPPDNLPTEEAPAKKPEAPPKPQFPQAPQIPQLPPTPQAPKTPEEILGLAAKKAEEPPKPPTHKKLSQSPHPPQTTQPPQLPNLPKVPKSSGVKFALVAGLLGIISVSILGTLVWKVLIQEPPPPPPPPAGPAQRPLPSALILYEELKTIEINELSYDTLKPRLDALLSSGLTPGSLAYIPIKLRTQEEVHYLTLAELLQTLQIDAPPSLLKYEEYTLFLYVQKAEVQTICQSAGVQSELCYGPRLGLVVKVPEASSLAQTAMKEWEKTLAEDLKPLMLFVPQLAEEAVFQTGQHKTLDTRYLNMPIHTMSIDWILTESHLIIATSKDAARAAVDRLEIQTLEEPTQ